MNSIIDTLLPTTSDNNNNKSTHMILRGHTKGVLSVCVSPDSTIIASGSRDKSVRLWELQTGNLITTLNKHMDSVLSVVFSPDSKWLVSGGNDKMLYLWDLTNLQADPKQLKLKCNLIQRITFTPDSKYLLIASCDNNITICSIAPLRILRKLNSSQGNLYGLAITTENSLITCGLPANDEPTLQSLNLNTGLSKPSNIPYTQSVLSLCLNTDSTLTATSGNQKDCDIRMWQSETGELLQVFKGHKRSIWSIMFSPDSKYLASASHDKSLRIWDTLTGEQVSCHKTHTASVYSLYFSADSNYIVSGSDDSTIQVWSLPQ